MQSLHRMEQERALQITSQQDKQSSTLQEALSDAHKTLYAAKTLIQNHGLVQTVKDQAGQIARLEESSSAKTMQAEQNKHAYQLQLANLETANSSKLDLLQRQCKEENDMLKVDLQIAQNAKSELEQQLAAEKSSTQNVLVNFGETQIEAQWKRKLSQLRAECKQMQIERDHYKKLYGGMHQ